MYGLDKLVLRLTRDPLGCLLNFAIFREILIRYEGLMNRLFVALLCLGSLLKMSGQSPLQAYWYLSQDQVYAGEPFLVELRLPLPESGSMRLSREIQFLIRVYLCMMVFQEEVSQDTSLSPFRLTDTDPPAYILFHRIVYQLKPGTYTLENPITETPSPIAVPALSIKIKDFPPTALSKAQLAANLAMSYRLDQPTYLTGEMIRLGLVLKGIGNIAMVPQPMLHIPNAFLIKEPSTRFETTWTARGLQGEKEFIYELTGAKKGSFTLGPARLYYFNLDTRSYDSVKIDQIPLEMRGRDIPQLLTRQNLDDFYRQAFADPSHRRAFRSPYTWVFILLAMLVAVFSFGLWGLRILYQRYRRYYRLQQRKRVKSNKRLR